MSHFDSGCACGLAQLYLLVCLVVRAPAPLLLLRKRADWQGRGPKLLARSARVGLREFILKFLDPKPCA
jgi:hypothetical protein